MKLLVLGLLIGSVSAAQAAKMAYDEALVPRFNVGHMQHPPTIDGTIGDDEWREATVAACRGMDVVFHAAGVAGMVPMSGSCLAADEAPAAHLSLAASQ